MAPSQDAGDADTADEAAYLHLPPPALAGIDDASDQVGFPNALAKETFSLKLLPLFPSLSLSLLVSPAASLLSQGFLLHFFLSLSLILPFLFAPCWLACCVVTAWLFW